MIRSSALLTAVAMAMLIAGVAAANLGLIYLSIAVSILAAVTLAAGVLLRRRELFGEAAAAPTSAQPGPAADEKAKAPPVPVRPASGDQITAGRGGRREDDRRDREQQGDLAAGPRQAGSGTAADTGPARWPASIAAKGAPATARGGGGRPPGRGRAAGSPSAREPAARKPGARGAGDWAEGEPGDREPAEREPAAQDATGREPVPTGRAERGAGSPPRSGREAGPGRPAESGRDRAGAARDRDPGRHRDAGRRERAGAARNRDPGRDQEPAAARQDQPAWSATAGPRAMGTGDAGGRDAGHRDVIPRPPGPPEEERGRDEQLAGPGAESNSGRVVPPYVDELARRDRQQRDPEPRSAGADEPGDDAARAESAAGPAAGSAWSAWSSARTGAQDAAAGAEEAGPDSAAHGERASRPEAADAASGTEPDTAGDGGDHKAEPAIRGAAATGAGTAADTGAPAGGTQPAKVSGRGEHEDAVVRGEAAPNGAERPDGADGPDDTAGAGADGSTSPDDEVTMVPGVPRYHLRGCILIRFLSDSDLETTTRRAAEAAGSVPCKACQPGKPASAG